MLSVTPPSPEGEGDSDDPLAIYVHWPFCVSKCPYCDFNSHVRAKIDEAGWRDALLADLAAEAAITPGRRVHSIFFGGGTPSLMDPATTAAIIDAVAGHWRVDHDVEITLEANPSSVEAARFAGFAAAGVNRVSLGLQALDDAALRMLGRPHDLAQGLAALDIAQANFPRVSFDLIYDRPAHTVEAWQAELARALSFGTEHLSLYQLTIEAGTRFAVLHAAGKLRTPDEETSADLFDLTQEMTEAAGLPGYETSNHARPGAASRHNLSYWTYGDYVGVGPGAHGRRALASTIRHKKPENWIAAVRTGSGISIVDSLAPEVRATEALMMGLRLRSGIDRAQFEQRTGVALATAVDAAAVAHLTGLGLVENDAAGLRLTRAGRPLVNAVLRDLAL
jgi:putative oxygen-independent coproporphyrinogen III oxidase